MNYLYDLVCSWRSHSQHSQVLYYSLKLYVGDGPELIKFTRIRLYPIWLQRWPYHYVSETCLTLGPILELVDRMEIKIASSISVNWCLCSVHCSHLCSVSHKSFTLFKSLTRANLFFSSHCSMRLFDIQGGLQDNKLQMIHTILERGKLQNFLCSSSCR